MQKNVKHLPCRKQAQDLRELALELEGVWVHARAMVGSPDNDAQACTKARDL